MRYSFQILNSCRFIGPCLLMLLQGCASNQQAAVTASPPYSEVRVQVCLPNKRVYFNDLVLDHLINHPLFTKYSPQQLELAPKTIRRVAKTNDPLAIRHLGVGYGEVLKRSGQYSDGGGWISLYTSTVANQPVFEQGYGYPANDYVAIHVLLPERDVDPWHRMFYWFTLPKNIPKERFTSWHKPVSMEPFDAPHPNWWALTHGGDLKIYPVAADAPRIRFTIVSHRESHTDPAVDTLPALTTARQQYRNTARGREYVYEFVPKADEVIPSCD